jgi:glutathione S-transferase
MITLHGFSISNYYNKVKMVLIEKGIPFNEAYAGAGSKDEAVLAASPLGKVPFISTPQGQLCESAVICEWLETTQPDPALLPQEPFAAAKVRELCTYIELHLELVVRELYGESFFGGQVSEHTKASVRKRLDKNIPAFKRLAKFSPYVAGNEFSLADCAAWASLPLVGMATARIYGEDLLASHGLDIKPYMALVGSRPSAQQVTADRKRDAAAAAAARSKA